MPLLLLEPPAHRDVLAGVAKGLSALLTGDAPAVRMGRTTVSGVTIATVRAVPANRLVGETPRLAVIWHLMGMLASLTTSRRVPTRTIPPVLRPPSRGDASPRAVASVAGQCEPEHEHEPYHRQQRGRYLVHAAQHGLSPSNRLHHSVKCVSCPGGFISAGAVLV